MPRSDVQSSAPAAAARTPLAATIAALIVRIVTPLVPGRDRERFRREWRAEIAHAAARPATRSSTLLRRALAAVRDALTLRSRRASGDSPDPLGRRPEGSGLGDTLRQDIRYGIRALRAAPGFTAVAVLTTALGIGATTTMFSFVNGILLRPLPYPEPDRVVAVWPSFYFSSQWYELMDAELEAYDRIAAFTTWEATWLTGEGANRIGTGYVTAGFFDVMQPRILQGRGFQTGDDAPGARVVVVTEGFWRQSLDGRTNVVGETLHLNGEEHVIVGVSGNEVRDTLNSADVVLPWVVDSNAPDYTSHDLKMMGRLRGDVTVEAARTDLQRFIASLRADRGLDEEFGQTATVVTLQEFLVGDSRSTLMLLFGAVWLTLVIAAANVANLTLARALSRQRELAVRVAMGAGVRRLVRQMLTESALLSLLAAIPGLLLASYGLRGVAALLPPDTPRLETVGVDLSTLAFAVLVALVTGCIVGVLPAVHAARSDVREMLASGGRTGSDSAGRQRLRRAVVVAEIAVAVALVAGAGLVARSFLNLTAVDPGLDSEGLVVFDVEPSAGLINSGAESHDYFDRLTERLERLPGVTSATTVWKVAFSEDGGINGFWRPDAPPDPGVESPLVRWRPVEDDYLTVNGLNLTAGRFFGPEDLPDGEAVAVISQSAARATFGEEDPIGRDVVTTAERDDSGDRDAYITVRVVGVVSDVKLEGLDQESPGVVYRPYRQVDQTMELFSMWGRWVVLRTGGPGAEQLASAVRRELMEIDRTALFADFTTMDGAIRSTLALREAIMILLLFFSAAAVTLGAVGIYGVMAYAVRQRTKEIGIRVALGATHQRVIHDVLGDAMKVAALGAGLGLLLAAATTRAVQQFLFDVHALDPVILGAAAAVAVLIAVTASLVPAWRAAQVDPATTLGSDD